KLPGYRVVGKLGSGGMGQVFLARQVEPVERDVAIKLIGSRIRTPENEVRFLVERQALAQMQHPAIAQIFDAGTNADGYPYFAMEYVPGKPLLQFCDENRLDLTTRLRIFIELCRGVAHAHQKGIVHRDLKPANILVSWVDDTPRPKIIDFGIASTQAAPNQRRHQSSAGTPVYMAPELFDEQTGIDIRADVYSLGVILCELLCGQRPWPTSLFRTTETEALRQALIARPPSPPSALVSGDESAAGHAARERRLSPAKLAGRLRGELDAIVLRAMHPDPERRYPNALELAEEIQRHLGRRPVEAVQGGRGYQLACFVRRNALAVAAVTGIMLALVAGILMAVTGLQEARKQQAIAETRSQELERVVGFQQSMLGDLEPRQLGEGFVDRLRRQYAASLEGSADPETIRAGIEAFETAVGRINPTDLAQDLLDEFMMQRAVDSIEQDFADQPHLQAELYSTVRDIYDSAGMFERSLPLAERVVELREQALGPAALATLVARQRQYRLLVRAGRLDEAQIQLDRIFEHMDPADPQQLDLKHDALDSRANLLVNLGRNEQALALALENLALAESELGPNHANTARALNTVGYVHALGNRLEPALDYFRQSLERARGHFEPTEDAYYSPLMNVGAALSALGRSEESLEYQREAYEILATAHGRRNVSTLRVMNNIAGTLGDLERYDEAEALLNETLSLSREAWGAGASLTLGIQQSLGDVYLKTGQAGQALALFEDIAQRRERTLGEAHPGTLGAMDRMVQALEALGQSERAE
ncbi:MAG: protein kinase domain-containing protein, partial [Wenzhouxiangellaceae bacterium]